MKIWNWLNGNKVWIAVVVSAVLSALGRRGIAIDPIVYDIADGLLGLGIGHKVVKKVMPQKAATTVALLALAVLVLPACQGLATALGVQPAATAPVYNGIGIHAAEGSEVWIDGASPDQSGNVAAKGDGTQGVEASQVNQLDPAAIAKGLAEVADIVVPAGRAAAMLARAEDALNSGDVKRASVLGRAARGLAEKEKADAEAEKAASETDPSADKDPAPVQ
jgi:hypothetical protein